MTSIFDPDKFLGGPGRRMRLREVRAFPKKPKYQELLDTMYAVIEAGEILPGQKFPPEAMWSDSINVSLGTVQKAMKHLDEAGMVVRKRAQGTFLSKDISPSSGVINYRFFDPETGDALPTQREILDVLKVDEPGPWDAHFEADDFLVKVTLRMRVQNDAPVFGQWIVQGRTAAELLTDPKALRSFDSLHDLIAQYSKRPSAHAEYRFNCVRLPEIACEGLSLSSGTPAVLWEFAEHGIDHRPATFGQIYLPEGHRPLVVQNIRVN